MINQQLREAVSGPEKDLFQVVVGKDKIATIADARTAKSELEQAITALIRNFEIRTMCPVIEVQAANVRTISGAHDSWRVKVSV